MADNDGLLPILGAAQKAAASMSGVKVYTVPEPEGDRLRMISETVQTLIGDDGKATVDLSAIMVTLPELTKVAASLDLKVSFVAILEVGDMPPKWEAYRGSESAQDLTRLDHEILQALGELGGTVAMGELCRHLSTTAATLRKRLELLKRCNRVARLGKGGSVKYQLVTELKKESEGWMARSRPLG